MRFDEGHESPDVIDRRGQGGGGGGLGGGGLFMLLPLLLRSPLGIVVLIVIVGGSLLGGIFGTRGEDAPRAVETTSADVPGDKRHFVAFVLDDAQKTWTDLFAKAGRPPYRRAKLVLFEGATSTACGTGDSATGPFYCPSDERAYIDLSFYDDLDRRFKASGDFAQAYVLAHEIGHHVQKLLGTSAMAKSMARGERQGAEGASVRLELQADCFAGIWAHATATRGLLEEGDIDEALRAASAIGDDRLQKRSQGRVTPDSFTHGTSAQRERWFKTGYTRGEVDACDTFAADRL